MSRFEWEPPDMAAEITAQIEAVRAAGKEPDHIQITEGGWEILRGEMRYGGPIGPLWSALISPVIIGSADAPERPQINALALWTNSGAETLAEAVAGSSCLGVAFELVDRLDTPVRVTTTECAACRDRPGERHDLGYIDEYGNTTYPWLCAECWWEAFRTTAEDVGDTPGAKMAHASMRNMDKKGG